MTLITKQSRLITVTRQDLSAGYQTVQSAHAVAEFAIRRPWKFLKWRLFGNYLISLAVKDKEELQQLMETLQKKKIGFVAFFEPDVNEITAIVLEPSVEADKATSSLKLAGRKVGDLDKHTKV